MQPVILDCFVPGEPKPGGSKRNVTNKSTGKVVMIDDCGKSVDWKRAVALFCSIEYRDEPVAGPVECDVTFYRTRPKSHYRTGRNAHLLKASAPRYPTGKPDVLKLMRSTEDALTGIIWLDDSQIVTETIRKRYGSSPGARIVVKHQPMDDNEKEASDEQRESTGA